jgi:hypothetical protein
MINVVRQLITKILKITVQTMINLFRQLITKITKILKITVQTLINVIAMINNWQLTTD